MDDIVWARDHTDGYILGRITELLEDGVEVTPQSSKFPKRFLPFSEIFRANLDDNKDYDDNCEMMFLNEGSLLNNIRIRYYKDKIYSYVANILIAVNPYKDIPILYAPETIKNYKGKSLGQLPPHVFAIADKAYRDMLVLKQSQSIIVSGESGAGKTESTKHLLKFLCDNWGAEVGTLEKKILDANPVLEAFGNAKTTRNNNSSRFGKFIEVHFDNKFKVAGGHISHYLLEKSRICSAEGDERNYHIFYLLLAGAPDNLRSKLNLTQPDDFNYLKHGCTKYFTSTATEKKLDASRKSSDHKKGALNDILLDDVNGFLELDQALSRLEINESDRNYIYATVAAVLHLGNIEFEDNPEDTRGGCRVIASKEKHLLIASKLLEIDPNELKQALISRVMQSARGGMKGTVIMVPLKTYEAVNARDALAKAIYSNLFDYIVNRINKSIPFQASTYYIGVLDIAGFEFFTVNSFEQFCINYCNEKLQQFFNDMILKAEQELYKREGLNVPEIQFVDNQDCIDVIETKNNGILTLLDEESKLPKPSYTHFTEEIHKIWSKEYRLGLPRSSKLKAHRNLRDNEGFLIRHFAGAVCYQTKYFIDKNNDALHASLEGIIQESGNKFIQALFSTSSTMKGKLTFSSVGNKFKIQLGELMEKLRSNGTNFIRCVKPNSKMVDQQFDGNLSLMQLKCSGMTTVLELMEYGYPSRTSFNELYQMYKQYIPKELTTLSPKQFCEAMFHALKLHDKDFKFGVTKVFFRPGKFAEFDNIMKSDTENMKNIIGQVKKWLVKSRWIKAQFCVLTVIKMKNKIAWRKEALIIVQKTIKGYLARKQHRHRILSLRNIRGLNTNLKQIEQSAQQLKKDKDLVTNGINTLKTQFEAAIDAIKKNEKMDKAAIEDLYKSLVDKVNQQMASLQKKIQEQKIAEEQERLRKIQEELEKQRKLKEEEERRLREEEENRRLKAEMEARRKIEEEERRKQEEADRLLALKLKDQHEKEDEEQRRLQEQEEQEKQDRELALRLAQESNGSIEESPPMTRNGTVEPDKIIKLNRSEAHRNHQASMANSKYDLSKWKYSDLRDTINTSCDIELLEACRHEFHRRLKVYHAWKAKNRKRNIMDENGRAPRSLIESAAKTPQRGIQKPVLDNNTQRFFRMAFQRPDNEPGSRGWWYAHFDGQYIARQMELHPNKAPVLLVAGKDDMQMCELSLEETGLTRRRGAEILENEFNKEWEKNGGSHYTRPADRK
ncbi:myosin heavy chain 95F isoform X2 [Diorhabda sublineata]|nr:myosin heavy chain 95F isoform X2 [Diorhabda sublineata]XP_056632357.1 myosin heavy chain 95F isoform X2 [Diorhabda sublineata]XP_056632358.1 myosin heavy chain 95F isoform X2 [Diorhabda sublineata]